MATVFLGIGSNLDAHNNVRSGIQALTEEFGTVQLSPAYRCPAVGFSGADFLNLVAQVETDRGPLQIKQYLNQIEDTHGRRRNVPKFSDRSLDIDVLLYDDLIYASASFKLPRPEVLEFAHVLKPLRDIAADRVHPLAKKTIGQLWTELALDDPLIPYAEPLV